MNERVPEIELLRVFAPRVEPSDDAMQHARERLDTLIDSEKYRRIDRRASRRMRPAALAIAACLAAVIVIGQTILPAERGGPNRATALERLEIVAANAIGMDLTPDGFAYQRSIVTRQRAGGDPTGESWTLVVEEGVETWIAIDGSGRTRTDPIEADFLSPADEGAWERAGSPALPTLSETDDRYAEGELTFVDITHAENDPVAVRSAIERSSSLGMPTTSLELLRAVADLLRRPYAPPEYRATLFRVVADIEGVEASSDGVEVLVSLAAERQRLELVFDAETSELLVERTIEIAPDGSEQLFQEIRYLESGIVASVEDRP